MEKWSIDINCDVGEGVGNEAELFPLISSCNIACGGHAGDFQSMSDIVGLAIQDGIKIGAHPSYPDRENFGREVMEISPMELQKSLSEQLLTFDKVLVGNGAKLHHIKAHGALYNQTAKDLALAKIYLDTIEKYNNGALLYVPYGSVVAVEATKRGFPIWYEAFADRNYNEDLSLVSRKQENALIKEPKKVLEHVLPMIQEGKVFAVTGKPVKIQTETLCVHGDTASALEILTYLSQMLPKHKVQLKP